MVEEQRRSLNVVPSTKEKLYSLLDSKNDKDEPNLTFNLAVSVKH
jgi:hypothetical protein